MGAASAAITKSGREIAKGLNYAETETLSTADTMLEEMDKRENKRARVW